MIVLHFISNINYYSLYNSLAPFLLIIYVKKICNPCQNTLLELSQHAGKDGEKNLTLYYL
jgi:hypothetical protein